MSSTIKNILAIIAGIIFGSMVNIGIITISSSIIPPPNGFDITTQEDLKAAMHLFEPKHFVLPFLAHALGTFAGAFVAAIIADKVGLKTIFITVLAFFASVYFGMSINTKLYFFFGLFFLYGVYASATEGISKAWISNITDRKDTATAIGTFSGLQSICIMLASSLTGLIWFQFGATAAFLTTASVTLLVMIYFFTIPKPTTIADSIK